MNSYLIDASIYIFRAYFSLPDRWHTAEGYGLNAVHGYASFLLDIGTQLTSKSPELCMAAFDESLGSCFRNDLYGRYKESRELPDESLAFQLQACREVTHILGMPSYAGDRYEADDYIAAIARLGREAGAVNCIVSRDKDLGQLLLNDGDSLWDYAGGARMYAADFADKFGVWPQQFADYLGLVGDASDDIPGVPGIGAKTAATLLQHYGDLDSLRSQLESIAATGLRGAARVRQNLEDNWGNALMSRSLALLADQIPGVDSLPQPWQLESQRVGQLQTYLQDIGIEGALLAKCRNLAQRLEGKQ